jgi:hypothetical protein
MLGWPVCASRKTLVAEDNAVRRIMPRRASEAGTCRRGTSSFTGSYARLVPSSGRFCLQRDTVAAQYVTCTSVGVGPVPLAEQMMPMSKFIRIFGFPIIRTVGFPTTESKNTREPYFYRVDLS